MKTLAIIFLITMSAVQSFGQDVTYPVTLDQVQELAVAAQNSNLIMATHDMYKVDGSKVDFNFDKGEKCLVGLHSSGLIQVYLEDSHIGGWGSVTTETQVSDLSYEFIKYEDENTVRINFRNSDRSPYSSGMIWLFDTTAENIEELSAGVRSGSSSLRGILVETRLDEISNPGFTHATAVCVRKVYRGS